MLIKKKTAHCGAIFAIALGFLPMQTFAQSMDGAIDYKRILKNFENLPLNEQYLALQEASAAQVKLAGFKPNPEISIGVENFMGSSPYKWLNNSETTLQISQDLQLFGRKNANINYAQSFSQTSKLQLEIAKQEFAKQLAIYWLEYEYAHNLKLLASEFLSATQNDLNIVSLLVEGGREPELRKLQAQDDVTNVNATLLNAQSRIVEAKSAIKAFAQYDGVIDNAKFEFLNKKPEINAFNLANNPQYNYLSSIKTSSNYAIELAKIENKPNASAFLGARHFAGDNAIAFVGGVSFKVPMGSKNETLIAQKYAEQKANSFALDNLINQLEGQRQLELAKINNSNQEISNLENLVKSQTDTYELIKIGFKASKLPLLELQAARQKIFETKQKILKSKYERALSEINIAFIEGRLPYEVSK